MSLLRDVLNEIAALLSFESPAREEEFVLDTQPRLPGLTSDAPQSEAPSPPALEGQGQTPGRAQVQATGQEQGHRQGQSQAQAQGQHGRGRRQHRGWSLSGDQAGGSSGEPSAVELLSEALPRTPYGFLRPRKMSTIKVGIGRAAARPVRALPIAHETSTEISPPTHGNERRTTAQESPPQGDKQQQGQLRPREPGDGQGQGRGQGQGQERGAGHEAETSGVPGGEGTGPGAAGQQAGPASGRGGGSGNKGDEVKPLAENLQANLDALKQVLHYGLNSDVIVREFDVPTTPPTRAAIVFMEGLASKDLIDLAVLQPLMLIANLDRGLRAADVLETIERRLLPGNQVTHKDNLRGIIEGVIAGTTCLLVEGCGTALEVETKSWEHRGVSQPTAETVVHGPQEAFNETLKNNVALVRRRMRTPDLVSEVIKVGTLSRVDCAVLYVEGLVNPKLVAEVKRRINGIRADQIQDTGSLEQFIEDRPFMLAPQTLSTERPDRMAAFLSEGHVGILLDGSPFGLVAPATFWALLQSAEDYYLRWPFGTFLRLVRLAALAVAVLLPAVYIALTNFHPEMLPTDLLLAIAATRERVPFPTVVEVLVMEVSFELIREAGIRVPGVIGPTLGIVGALILGQAAVAASIVSPILVIIVAVTALGSFAVPNFNMAFAARLTRFVYIFVAAAFGFYGIAVGVFLQMLLYVNARSFGVPFMSPVAPFAQSSGDLILRYPSWSMELRPAFLQTRRRERQPEVARKWTPSGTTDAPSPDSGTGQMAEESSGGRPTSRRDKGGRGRA
ncbi:MAG: spore germination protein [Bacteroidota bacterium]